MAVNKRIWKRICGNCGYWYLLSTASAVGYRGKYWDGRQLRGLCKKSISAATRTLENDSCFNDQYRFISDTK